MAFVSITRLRVRSVRFMPAFLLHTLRTFRQARRADGLIDGTLLADRARAFWTVTLWRGEADMRRYMTGGAHLKAMPRLLDWCDEASVVHWIQDQETLPGWDEADRRMRAEGRPSKVRNPSPDHHGLSYAPPDTRRRAPIRPRRPS